MYLLVLLALPFALVLNVVGFFWYVGDAAQIFFMVLGGTAQGRNVVKVGWPSGPFAHRFSNAWYLLTLLVLSVVPSIPLFFLDIPDSPGLPAAVLIIGASLWLFFPIVLLSVAGSVSTWAVCRWSVFRSLMGRWLTALAFYLLSAPLIMISVLMVYLALVGWRELVNAAGTSAWTWLPTAVVVWSWVVLLPCAAAFIAAVLLIYARLVGRLAWLLEWDGHEEPGPAPTPPPPPPAFPMHGEATAPAETEAAGQAEEVYRFRDEPSAGPALASVDPVRLASQVPEPLPSLPPPQDMVRSEKAPRLLVRGIYEFPWYRSTRKTWILLAVFSLLLLLWFRIQLWLVT